MHNPTNKDIFNSIFKLIGILNQLIKQIEDLQDIISEQNHQSAIQQDALENFLKHAKPIPLNAVFTFKKDKHPIPFPKLHPDIKINKPEQKKDVIFWLPNSSDCNSIAGMN